MRDCLDVQPASNQSDARFRSPMINCHIVACQELFEWQPDLRYFTGCIHKITPINRWELSEIWGRYGTRWRNMGPIIQKKRGLIYLAPIPALFEIGDVWVVDVEPVKIAMEVGYSYWWFGLRSVGSIFWYKGDTTFLAWSMHSRKLMICNGHLQRDTLISYTENDQIARRVWNIFLVKIWRIFRLNLASEFSDFLPASRISNRLK